MKKSDDGDAICENILSYNIRVRKKLNDDTCIVYRRTCDRHESGTQKNRD